MVIKMKTRKSEIKSEYFTKELINRLDDRKPMFSMMLLALAIVENCFAGKYIFRTYAMERRLHNHGVLPKSFFRESFLRCTKLMKLLRTNKMTVDDLLDKVILSESLQSVQLIDRKENKVFYKLIKGDNDV